MAIRKDKTLTPEQYNEVRSKFVIAQDNVTPANQFKDMILKAGVQEELRDMIFEVGLYISENVELSRERVEAHTKLEEALMWAGKAISKEPNREGL